MHSSHSWQLLAYPASCGDVSVHALLLWLASVGFVGPASCGDVSVHALLP